MTSEPERQDDEPLDPAAENLRRKLMRLLIFSMGFMILSVLTVFGVIIYKTTRSSEPVYDGTPVAIPLPGGGEIIDTALDANRLLLTVRSGDAVRLVLVDRTTGAIVSEYVIDPSAPVPQ
ncbi:hypothetical protein U0C82_10270 [Fulvimarina sp. 2208YS6-2-32]|uniref:Fimbrial protein n=1 Tax=Fulvimarina uroteuthidis TaxID=3098149 RepID=A0ABU5I432_9HYPH|nr:hypothetical protein [Fulvimarina sp. 2208YS6-2-32]MDY8109523.1 hypothetical protein [Fulvimarina sp. 2208YS6-2-32]